jgi:hypothetical protein
MEPGARPEMNETKDCGRRRGCAGQAVGPPPHDLPSATSPGDHRARARGASQLLGRTGPSQRVVPLLQRRRTCGRGGLERAAVCTCVAATVRGPCRGRCRRHGHAGASRDDSTWMGVEPPPCACRVVSRRVTSRVCTSAPPVTIEQWERDYRHGRSCCYRNMQTRPGSHNSETRRNEG